MLDLEVVFGAVAAIVSNNYLIGTFLGKLIAISVLDLGIIEEYLNGCFLGKIRKSYGLLCTTFLIYTINGESRRRCINGNFEGVGYAVSDYLNLVSAAFGKGEDCVLHVELGIINDDLFKARDRGNIALKLAYKSFYDGEGYLRGVAELIGEFSGINAGLNNIKGSPFLVTTTVTSSFAVSFAVFA